MVYSPVKYATDGDHIRDHQGDEVEGNDGVEGDVGTKVDKAQDEGEGAGHDDSVGGDFEGRMDVRDPAGDGKTLVSSEGPGLSRGGQVVGEGPSEDQDDYDRGEGVDGGEGESGKIR